MWVSISPGTDLGENVGARVKLVLWVLEEQVLLGSGRGGGDAVVKEGDEIVSFSHRGLPQSGEDAGPWSRGFLGLGSGVGVLDRRQETGVLERVGNGLDEVLAHVGWMVESGSDTVEQKQNSEEKTKTENSGQQCPPGPVRYNHQDHGAVPASLSLVHLN